MADSTWSHRQGVRRSGSHPGPLRGRQLAWQGVPQGGGTGLGGGRQPSLPCAGGRAAGGASSRHRARPASPQCGLRQAPSLPLGGARSPPPSPQGTGGRSASPGHVGLLHVGLPAHGPPGHVGLSGMWPPGMWASHARGPPGTWLPRTRLLALELPTGRVTLSWRLRGGRCAWPSRVRMQQGRPSTRRGRPRMLLRSVPARSWGRCPQPGPVTLPEGGAAVASAGGGGDLRGRSPCP